MAEDTAAADEAGAKHLDDLLAQEGEIEALKAERDDLRDRYMRALADAENSRKRADRDRREAENYGSTRLARDLLPVFDNLNRALAAVTDEQRAANAALLEGVELTLKELTAVMSKLGVKPIEARIGDLFDAQTMEAMTVTGAPCPAVGAAATGS